MRGGSREEVRLSVHKEKLMSQSMMERMVTKFHSKSGITEYGDIDSHENLCLTYFSSHDMIKLIAIFAY